MLTIRHEPLRPGFDKYHVQGLPFGCAFHEITKADIGLIHDHPYGMEVTVKYGGYVERVYRPDGFSYRRIRKKGDRFYNPATLVHQIIKILGPACWTEVEPDSDHLRREWNFWKFEDGKAYYRQWNEQDWKLLK